MADEPTGNLDEETGRLVINLLGELGRGRGVASVWVTHEAQLADAADRVLILEKWKVGATMKASRTRFIVWDDRLRAWSKQRRGNRSSKLPGAEMGVVVFTKNTQQMLEFLASEVTAVEQLVGGRFKLKSKRISVSTPSQSVGW